jgi:bifunctional DNA-binding transcriptional regulator/antitoxin component of YhaV-PrlF toxin-antitoxin module
MAKVKKRRRGYTTISEKHQATIPVEAMKRAGLRAGDAMKVEAEGRGRIVFERAEDVIDHYAGALDVYGPGYLEELRDEWR